MQLQKMGLHTAAAEGDEATLTKLLEEEGVEVDTTDERDQTALHLAAGSGQLATVTLLLQHGA